MSDSETSSEIQVKYQNSNGDNLLEDKSKKVQSTDTDYYFNMIANPNKIVEKSSETSESSDLEHLLENTESSISNTISSKSSKSSKSKSSSKSKNSSSSRAKYDTIPISPKINNMESFQQHPQQHPQFQQHPQPQPQSQSQSQPQFQQQPQSQPQFQIPKNNIPQPNIQFGRGVQQPVQQPVVEPIKILSPQEIKLKKIEMIRKLSELKRKGYQLTKEYDFNSSLEEMEYEYELLKSFADKRNGVRIYKSGLLQAVSVIEWLNDTYDPFDLHLSGWSDHLQIESDNWEDVFEEIYEKYKGSGKKWAPEIKLLYLMIASASAFHFTKSHGPKLPGLDAVLAANPGLLSNLINTKNEKSEFMTPQELNIEKQKEELKKREQELRKREQEYKKQDFRNVNMNISNNDNKPSNKLPEQIPANELRPKQVDIRMPSQAKEILDRIHNIQANKISNDKTETQDDTSSNNDRLISETTISESNPKKKYQRKQKPSISIR